MHSDPIADFLTRIRNASRAKHSFVEIPYSTMREQLAEILEKKKFVKSVKIVRDQKFPFLRIYLDPELSSLVLIRKSKPGRRSYQKSLDIRSVKNGYGIGIYSTSKGLLTDHEARELKIGGEFLCEVY
jgi:small subunit ribosomal protein S8